MSNTKRDFDAALKAFVKTQGELVGLARECANMAIQHFAEHGDVSYLQRLHDAFVKNFMRRTALVAWACDFMPLEFKQGKFSKDKRENAVEPRLVEALQVDFWDYKPEAVVEFYVGSDVLEALKRTIKQFENTDRKAPADENAVAFVKSAKNAIEQLGNIVAALPKADRLPQNEATSPASLN